MSDIILSCFLSILGFLVTCSESVLALCDPNSTALLDAPNTVNGDLIYYKCDHPNDRLTPDSCGKQFILNSKMVYQKCGLSNPRTSPELCGRTRASTLCDPDGILTQQQGDDISAELDRIYKDSPCKCGNCQDNPRGTPIWVAIVKHLAITDLSVKSNERCVYGSCNDMFPKLDPQGRPPEQSELDLSMKELKEQLFKTWKLKEDCSTDVIIVYEGTHKQVSIAYQGGHTSLKPSNIHSIISSARPEFEEGNIAGGIKYLISGIEGKLQPKRTAFIIGVTISCIVGVFIIFGVVAGCIYCRKMGRETGGGCMDGCQMWWMDSDWNIIQLLSKKRNW